MTHPSQSESGQPLRVRVATAIWDAMVDDEPPDERTLAEYGYLDAADAAIKTVLEDQR